MRCRFLLGYFEGNRHRYHTQPEKSSLAVVDEICGDPIFSKPLSGFVHAFCEYMLCVQSLMISPFWQDSGGSFPFCRSCKC
jgi:hypothetical protein